MPIFGRSHSPDSQKPSSRQTSPRTRRQYSCSICHKVFGRLDNLKRHCRTHTGERPYCCTYPSCHKCFARSDQLARHQTIHTSISQNLLQDDKSSSSTSETKYQFCFENTFLHSKHDSRPNDDGGASSNEMSSKSGISTTALSWQDQAGFDFDPFNQHTITHCSTTVHSSDTEGSSQMDLSFLLN